MKSVLITGGSGSFGNAFVRRLLADGVAERIVVYSRDEQKQDAMAHALADHPRFATLRFFIGDVRDCDRLSLAMHDISTVVHAAALKIVPAAEYNPPECIATNIHGAENVVKAAIRAGVKRVVALSTDKAVNPINLYGASKLCAEKIFIAANALAAGSVAFSVVRYGNVIGSRGSVVPLFQRLAKEGKPLPVTDKRMTRFWISMDDAINLILLCINSSPGRRIYIPKIPSIKITDLAEAIAGAPFWIETGIRPGEKIHECLLTEDESRDAYEYGDTYIIDSHGPVPTFARKFIEPFRYTSDGNDWWLSVEQLREMNK